MAAPLLLAGAGLVAQLLGRLQDTGNRADQIRHRERFSNTLRDIQEASLQAQHARRNYALTQSENIAYGQQAASMSASRMGVAGTASATFQTVMDKYDFKRAGFALEYQEKMAKLAVERSASDVARENAFDLSNLIVGGVADTINVSNQIMDQMDKFNKSQGYTGGAQARDPTYRDAGQIGSDPRFTGDINSDPTGRV